MNKIEAICRSKGVALCYLFGSQAELGRNLLIGRQVELFDPEADIDFAVIFKKIPADPLKMYALLSLEFQSLVVPFKADLLFLHEVDHLIQLEVIKGICIYAANEVFRREHEEKVMMFAADEIEIFRRNEKDLFEAMDNGYFEFEYKATGR